ncbi:NERD domain-containing protein [Nocardia nova]|uniref:nuclease-related domain-containing protein n=1 Tax=Nocardia nova TaxID=37330 RepID=UPI001C46B59E|nr:nuclease-related domain-containing protein [Nocardia nova]MBV7705417.1 NERD domain-containing protein [Nocardia nova]
MLVINGDITKPKTQQQVVEWLANYVTQPGIAVSGVYIPRLDGGSTEADLLVFTPHAAAVIEVDALRKKTRGPLSYSMNERWSAPGIHGDPVQLRGDDLNPLHQVRRPVSALRTFVAELTRGPEPFVDGLTLLIPKSGNTVTLDKGPMPAGFTVLLGDSASQLYSWFGRTAQHRDRTPWTAELVVTVLTALRVDRTRDAESRRRLYAELVAEGFPTEVSAVPREGDGSATTSTPASASPDAPAARPEQEDWNEPNSQGLHAGSHNPSSQIDSTPATPPTSAAVATSPDAKAHQPERADQARPNPQVAPTDSHLPPSQHAPHNAAPTAASPDSAQSTSPVSYGATPPASHADATFSAVQTSRAAPKPASTQALQTDASPAPAPAPAPREPGTDSNFRTQPPARHRLRTALLGIAAVLILICGIGYMAGKDHPRAQSDSQPAPSQVRPPERTTTPAPPPTEPPGTQQHSTTPTEGATCYPFQAGC